MKKQLTLTSHYNKVSLVITLDAAQADAIMHNKYYHPMEMINNELTSYRCHGRASYLSGYMCKRINDALVGNDYFDKIEETK